jgi:hypothetical protein
MHYWPAALIGRFGVPSSGKSPRDNRVWVSRKGVDRPFLTAASKVGYDPSNPQIYRGPLVNLDDVWQRAEGHHGMVQRLLSDIVATGVIPAEAFACILVPYVAHLIARQPRLFLPDEGMSDLIQGSESHDKHLALRFAAMWKFADALLTARKWFVVVPPDGVELVTTDLGLLWGSGPTPGEIFLPLSPKAALVIWGGGHSYDPRSDWVEVPRLDWETWAIEVRRDAMILATPHDVYTSSEETAIYAHNLCRTPPPSRSSLRAGDRATAFDLAVADTHLMAGFVQDGAAMHPQVAHARVLCVQHRWACSCDEAFADVADPVSRREMIRARDQSLWIAEAMLREQGLWRGPTTLRSVSSLARLRLSRLRTSH